MHRNGTTSWDTGETGTQGIGPEPLGVCFSYTEVRWLSNHFQYVQDTQRWGHWVRGSFVDHDICCICKGKEHPHTSAFISWAGLSPDEALSYSLSLMECFIKSLSDMCSVLALLCRSVYCPDSDVTIRLMCRIFHCYGLLLSSIC